MMDWISLHRQSEKFARQAHEKLGAGDDIGAKRAFAEAAKLEAQALDLLDVNKERTRGVAAVSATSLWYKAGELGSPPSLHIANSGWAAFRISPRSNLKSCSELSMTRGRSQSTKRTSFLAR